MRLKGVTLRGRCHVGGLRLYKDRRRESLTKRSPGASLTGSSSSKIHLKGVKIYVCSKIFICLYIKLGSSVDKEKENARDASDWLIAVLDSTRRWTRWTRRYIWTCRTSRRTKTSCSSGGWRGSCSLVWLCLEFSETSSRKTKLKQDAEVNRCHTWQVAVPKVPKTGFSPVMRCRNSTNRH